MSVHGMYNLFVSSVKTNKRRNCIYETAHQVNNNLSTGPLSNKTGHLKTAKVNISTNTYRVVTGEVNKAVVVRREMECVFLGKVGRREGVREDQGEGVRRSEKGGNEVTGGVRAEAS